MSIVVMHYTSNFKTNILAYKNLKYSGNLI